MIVHLKTKSISNKFDVFLEEVKVNVGVLVISETKIDDSSPVDSFIIEDFTVPYSLDRNCLGSVNNHGICSRRYHFKTYKNRSFKKKKKRNDT